jgi:Tfp pilus assembly protein PilX
MIQVAPPEVYMKTWRRLLGNERGVALPLAMILLMILTMLTITFMSLGAVEPQISRNLSDGARARQLAESGIEWAYNQLSGKTFDSLLTASSTSPTAAPGACGTGLSCVVICTGGVACSTLGSGDQSMPGLTTTSGTFLVTIRNDLSSNTGDQALIGSGNTVDGSATLDSNNIVILKSTGTFNGASRTITAVIERGKLLFNAAVNLPGDQGDTFIDTPNAGWTIDGRDWRDSDTTSPGGAAALKYGIATSSTSIESDVEDAFDTSAKRTFVQGKNETGGSSVTTGHNTMQTDNTLTKSMINDFMANLAANPQTQIIESTHACSYAAGSGDRNKPEGLRMTGISGTPNIVTVTNNGSCGTPINQTVNIGTASSPKMLYVKGEFDPNSLFRGLVVEGNEPITGYGILVIEDSDLAFVQSSNFRWNGIVLVTGRNNSTAFLGNSSTDTEIRGALVVNETNPLEPCCFYEFYASGGGDMKLRASKENIDRALLALYNMRISAFREN